MAGLISTDDSNKHSVRVANELGLGTYWPGGSKQPAIRQLLGSVIAVKQDFSALILKIVERSITYQKNPLTREQFERLNEIFCAPVTKFRNYTKPLF